MRSDISRERILELEMFYRTKLNITTTGTRVRRSREEFHVPGEIHRRDVETRKRARGEDFHDGEFRLVLIVF